MFEQFLGPDNFDIMPHLVAISLAYVLAFPIGWNREKSERSAGLRTFPLVAVASCGFIQAAESITGDAPEAMARIVEGLITGMGFIGGGAILSVVRTFGTDLVVRLMSVGLVWRVDLKRRSCGAASADVRWSFV